jgi:hypothetical protein
MCYLHIRLVLKDIIRRHGIKRLTAVLNAILDL